MGQAALCARAAMQNGIEDPFYTGKMRSAEFAITQWLPVGRAQRAVIEAGLQCLGDFESH